MPDHLKQESAQSDHPVQRKSTKRGPIPTFLLFFYKYVFFTTFWSFSTLSDRIESIPFRVGQTSYGTNLDTQQQCNRSNFW